MLIEQLSDAYLDAKPFRFGRFIRGNKHNIHLHDMTDPDVQALRSASGLVGIMMSL